MRRLQNIFIILIAAYATSCINRNEVRLVSRNFEAEIEQQQNLVFTFDRDLVPDTVTGRWDTLQYISFTPAVNGRFKWNSKREIMFSPVNGFRPSTEYKAYITPQILKFAPGNFSIQQENSLSFHTAFLKLNNATGYWSVSDKFENAAKLSITLSFNCDINPELLIPLLQVYLADKPAGFRLNSTSPGNSVTISVDSLDKNSLTNLPVKLVVNKGLRCFSSDYQTREEQQFSMIVPSPEKLEIAQAAGEYAGTEAMIHIYTNQSVEKSDIVRLISIDPKINFTVEYISDGFFLKGPFTEGLSYQVKISKELKGELGGQMESDFSQLIPFGALEPAISFVSRRGIYLSSKSDKNVALNIINVPRIQVKIKKIYENNIIHYLKNNRWRDYEYYEEDEYNEDYSYDYNDYNFDLYGDQVFERYYDTKSLAKRNGAHLLNLSFDDEKNYKGIYLVNVSSANSLYTRDSKLISVSDLGLLIKKTDDEVYVFVNSIKSAEPVSGSVVSFISSNNQTLYTATTDGDGVAVFRNVRSRAPDFNVAMITAKSGSDFNYLLLNDTRVNDSRFDVGGRRINPGGSMAFIYGDRDIYRPGETVYLNTVVLDEKWNALSNIPVKIKLLLPNGKEFKALRGTLNSQGAFATSFPLPVSTVTGTYVAEVYTANDVLLESRNFSVEEFMPDRIDVRLETNKDHYSTGDSILASVKALNLFGPPAAGRKYEVEYSLAYKYFSPKSYPGYIFGINRNEIKEFPKTIREGKTNAGGQASEIFVVDKLYKNLGLLEGKIFTTVFDETGRPVNRAKRFDIYTQDVFYGIKINEYYVNAKQSISFPLIAVDKNGKAVSSSARIQIIQHDWYSVIERNGSSYRYVSHANDRIMLDQEIKISTSNSVLNYVPGESGQFEVRISEPGSEHYVSASFYSYSYGTTQNTSFPVNTEGEVDIRLDKEIYNPGDKANILFTTPFNGKLLVTVECDKVLEYYYLATDKKSARFSLPVKESYLPNVYITATLFRPLDDGAIPLTVGHGFMPMIVNAVKNKLPVSISAVAQSRSKTKQTIKIKTRPSKDIELTVAVVDEGILQLKNFKTPDPYGFFYQKKALNVSAYDLYPNLLPDLKLKKSVAGGDAFDLEKRVNPLTNKRVKLVAFWSGILHTNSSGEASYTIDIPQFSGDLRIMACAYKDKAFGSAEAHMKIADPVIISPSIPRFLSPKDTLIMPVTFTNTTKQKSTVVASVSLDGALKVLGSAGSTLTINAGEEQRAEFRILASPSIGNASITVNAKAFGEQFSDKTDITIRPSASLLKLTDAGAIEGNSSRTLNLNSDFIPSSVKTRLIVSRNPMVQFSDQLNYLLGYPHGCLEQTTSKAFPLIYFGELVKNVKNAQVSSGDPHYYVQEAIRKIQMMQIYNGSLTYWPGGINENWWSTAYATHFLLEAKKAGYDVNDDMLDRCISYLMQKVKTHETEKYYYRDEANILRNRVIAKKENAYSLYIIALYGKPDISSMNYYKSNLNLLSLDSRYLLAGTYLSAGDRKSYDEILPKEFSGERSETNSGGSFYSYIRDQAVSLNALLETDPGNPQVGMMVRHLSQQLNKQKYLNTQERAFAFLALGKFMKRQNESNATADVLVNNISLAKFEGKELVVTKGISGKPVVIKTAGTGSLYYYLEEEGISAKGIYKEEDSYLRVRKSFFNRFGQAISTKEIKQGELIVVKIVLQNTAGSKIENVVVTDMLPAGFEIENPRIGEVSEMNWIKDETQPEYFDVRDDRINFYTGIEDKAKNFYYLVRAVSPGNYTMGPVSADAMYNGEYHSYNGAGVIKIVQ